MIKILRPPLPPEMRGEMYEAKKKREKEKESKRQDVYTKELVEVFYKIGSNRELLNEFLKDILTPKEYKTLAVRWQIIKQLAKGFSQRQIADNLGISTATITRGSRELLDKQGGFAKVLKTYYANRSY